MSKTSDKTSEEIASVYKFQAFTIFGIWTGILDTLTIIYSSYAYIFLLLIF